MAVVLPDPAGRRQLEPGAGAGQPADHCRLAGVRRSRSLPLSSKARSTAAWSIGAPPDVPAPQGDGPRRQGSGARCRGRRLRRYRLPTRGRAARVRVVDAVGRRGQGTDRDRTSSIRRSRSAVGMFSGHVDAPDLPLRFAANMPHLPGRPARPRQRPRRRPTAVCWTQRASASADLASAGRCRVPSGPRPRGWHGRSALSRPRCARWRVARPGTRGSCLAWRVSRLPC